jgi:glyoxylase-like metal-dependent hydrolase (beta-lactamase superfamily II)
MTALHQITCPIPYPLKTVNCYYISDSCPTLIDCGVNTPESIEPIETAIRRAGGSLRAVQRVIVTHAHTDHAGLAGRLADAFGAEVFIHHHDFPKFISADPQQNRTYFERFQEFLRFCGVPDDQGQVLTDAFAGRVRKLVAPLEKPRLLSGGETFAFDDFELQVVPTPGHSAGSISLVNAAEGVIFAGDFLLEHITPNPVAEFGLAKTCDGYGSLARFTASLQWLVQQDLTRVLPGHGPAFTRVRSRGASILDHFERRRKQVLRMIAHDSGERSGSGGLTLLELSRRMFPGLKEMAVFLGLSEAFAYIQSLESESRIETWQEQGIGRCRLKSGSRP